MSDCRCLDWEVASQLGNYWQHNLTFWLYQNRKFPRDLITRYHMELSILATHLDGRARPRRCSKSTTALFSSNTHLRQFYLLLYILALLIPVTTSLYTSIQDSRNTWDLLMYLILSAMCCILAELSYICQTVGVWIGKWLPN